MYMMSRGFRILRNLEETQRLHGELLRLINDNTDVTMNCWVSAFSAAPNSMVYTAMVNSRQEVMDAMAKLATVPEYSSLVDTVRANQSPPVDAFRWVLNADAIDMSAEPKPIAIVMSAQIVGDMGKAFEWSNEMAAYSSSVTGASVATTVNTIGPMGQINWMAGHDTMDSVDAAEMALWSDPAYMERLAASRSAGYFGSGPGATGGSIWMRV